MKSLIDPKFEEYARRHSQAEPDLLKRLVRETRAKTKYPQMQVGHLEGLFLQLLVSLSHARTVVEIGTFTGYSAFSMALGLPKNGKVITLDVDPTATKMARRYWGQHPVGRKIKLVMGNALDSLRKIRGPLDLVFIDADKENYIAYWNACVPKLCRGGLVVADNVLWSGRVLNPKDKTDQAIARFNRHVKADRRMRSVMLPVRDGITLAYKVC